MPSSRGRASISRGVRRSLGCVPKTTPPPSPVFVASFVFQQLPKTPPCGDSISRERSSHWERSCISSKISRHPRMFVTTMHGDTCRNSAAVSSAGAPPMNAMSSFATVAWVSPTTLGPTYDALELMITLVTPNAGMVWPTSPMCRISPPARFPLPYTFFHQQHPRTPTDASQRSCVTLNPP